MSVSLSNSVLMRFTLISLLTTIVGGCAIHREPPLACADRSVVAHDPAERVNRSIFAFNRTLDDYVVAPVARGYRHLPGFVQSGVHNFVANFGEPKVFINDLLQGNGRRAVDTVGRFALNTTVGIVGLIDVSGRLGVERHHADFGQTFGVWNIGNGPIVELPLLGTSNLRDATGRLLGFAVDPVGSNSDNVDTLKTVDTVGDVVDGRAQRLPLTDRLRTGPDYYAGLRDLMAQRRAVLVEQGKLGAAGNEGVCQAPEWR